MVTHKKTSVRKRKAVSLPSFQVTAVILSLLIVVTALFLGILTIKAQTALRGKAFVAYKAAPTVPGDVLDLSGWYLTLPDPVQNPPKKTEPYTVVMGGQTSKQMNADLRTFSNQWFHLNDTKDGVTFRAPTNGATTTNSFNPRSELREMINGGKTKAAWSSSSSSKDGIVHSMYIEQMVTHLPVKKPQVVVGQIHDSSDDVTVFRLKGNQLCITDGNNTCAFTAGTVELNQRFSVKMEMVNGVISYYFNGTKVPYTLSKNISGAYFKAGMYTQSTCDTNAGSQYAGDSCDAYGENTIYVLEVCHGSVCIGNRTSQPSPISSVMPTNSATPTLRPSPTAIPSPSVMASAKPSASPVSTGKVQGLKATSTKDSVVVLSWEKYPGTSKYKIFMDKYNTGEFETNRSTSSTKYTYKNLKSKQTSYFRIHAYDSKGKQIGISDAVGVLVK